MNMMQDKVVGSSISEEERKARIDLAAAFRLADHLGWSLVTWNHITAKVPGPDEHFLINQNGLRFDEITASNLVKVDKEGNVIDGPDNVPIAGFVIHSAIHRAREGIGAVFHTHTDDGLVVAAMKDGLLPLVGDNAYVYGDVAFHPYEGVSDDLSERDRMARNLGEKNCLILQNHGLLTVGRDISEAFMRMYWLNQACRVQIKLLATGAPYQVIPPDVLEHTRLQLVNDFAPGRHEWQGLLRLAYKLDPSFAF
jgi:ribulose-5-phosphate 4-epimerase/fuculose-1-phosphate aldolase